MCQKLLSLFCLPAIDSKRGETALSGKAKAVHQILETGLVPIVRAASPEDAFKAAEAIVAGGVSIAEITMTVPGAIRVIEKVADRYGDKVLLGRVRFSMPRPPARPYWPAPSSWSARR